MNREILLIDDDEDELEIFCQALNSFDKNIQCHLARNLDEALKFLDSTSPAYVFIDFNMPKQNGIDCLIELKKIKKLKDSRFILYSNHLDNDLTRQAMEFGAYSCVKKPNMINLLARRLKEIINS